MVPMNRVKAAYTVAENLNNADEATSTTVSPSSEVIPDVSQQDEPLEIVTRFGC